MIPINAAIGLGLILFLIGLIGVLIRKNIIIVLMAMELLLNGINIIFAAFGSYYISDVGSVFALFVIMIAVAEAAVAFALILAYFRHKETYSLDEINDLKG